MASRNRFVQAFIELHKNPSALMLPNVWDAATARLAMIAGARAIATTSAGVAWTLGYIDGENLSTQDVIDSAASILRVVEIPVSIDIEAGYCDTLEELGAFCVSLARMGAVGVNIEDGADAPDLLCAKIEAMRAALSNAGHDLYINARTDVYLKGLAEEGERVAETIRRAKLYGQAGADGLFVPGLVELSEIRSINAGPEGLFLNVMASPGLAKPSILAEHGVARISAGSSIAQIAYLAVDKAYRGFMKGEDVASAEMTPYEQMNKLF